MPVLQTPENIFVWITLRGMYPKRFMLLFNLEYFSESVKTVGDLADSVCCQDVCVDGVYHGNKVTLCKHCGFTNAVFHCFAR